MNPLYAVALTFDTHAELGIYLIGICVGFSLGITLGFQLGQHKETK